MKPNWTIIIAVALVAMAVVACTALIIRNQTKIFQDRQDQLKACLQETRDNFGQGLDRVSGRLNKDQWDDAWRILTNRQEECYRLYKVD